MKNLREEKESRVVVTSDLYKDVQCSPLPTSCRTLKRRRKLYWKSNIIISIIALAAFQPSMIESTPAPYIDNLHTAIERTISHSTTGIIGIANTTTTPTVSPTKSPSPTESPTASPTGTPTDNPTPSPTSKPSPSPSERPSSKPTSSPTSKPSISPTASPSDSPSDWPTANPSDGPSLSPTKLPSLNPSSNPSSNPTESPSLMPSESPTYQPSNSPSTSPSSQPTLSPTSLPSSKPSLKPTGDPTAYPTFVPSTTPLASPSSIPSTSPSDKPSASPSVSPSDRPSAEPTSSPSVEPTATPSASPSVEPTSHPSTTPTDSPSTSPSANPTAIPSESPTISAKPSASPTSMPTSSPSTNPTADPTSAPSAHPTAKPSASPSSSPTYSLQTFKFFIDMTFDDQKVFDGRAKSIFEEEVDATIKIVLEENNANEEFDITSKIYAMIVPEVTSQPGGTRRTLLEFNELQSYGSLLRGLQEENTALTVRLETYVSIRSGTTYTDNGLRSDISRAFDEEGEREAFIEALQLSNDNSFSRINSMDISINDVKVEETPDNNDLNSWIYIGPGIGAGALLVSLAGFLFYRRNSDEMSFMEAEFDDQIPAIQSQPTDEVHVHYGDDDEREDNDVSTLGFENPGGLAPMMFTDVVQEDDPTNASSFSADFDFKAAYGLVGDESISTAGGTRSALGTGAPTDNTGDDLSRERSDVSSKIPSRDISLFDDDFSFDAMYGEEERIEVIAPAGKLGVVVDRPDVDAPVVHAIKETSVLADRVKIGDKLISVDGEDTTKMSAVQVSKLIASKAMNAQRMMVFIRSPPMP